MNSFLNLDLKIQLDAKKCLKIIICNIFDRAAVSNIIIMD
jgi:hypothetical protein